MKRFLGSICTLALLLLAVSCHNDSIYAGFKKMENGAYMKFYSKGDSDVMPRLKDEVTIEMSQFFNDTMLFSTAGKQPIKLVLKEADFVGDVADGLMMMHVGDSARLVVSADSMWIRQLQVEEIPERFAGKPIYYDMKLISVKPFEILEAERKALLDSLKQAEFDLLAPLKGDPSNTLTESGLIIMEKTGKGKTARLGDYVDFDFTVTLSTGDTIMNSFGVESVDKQCGEEFICKGMTEALGLVPEGGRMRFVIPSELAFDSIGYEKYLLPYTTLFVMLKMNSVTDQVEHDKKVAAQEAEKEALRARKLAEESKIIEDYVKANNITESPTESGLYIIRQKEGEGAVAKWGDEVAVHYILKNLKDETIESSYDFGMPMTFTIGGGEMIPAIDEALMTMAPGAKVTVLTPSEQAYGDYEFDELIPPYSPLVIELELVEIVK